MQRSKVLPIFGPGVPSRWASVSAVKLTNLYVRKGNDKSPQTIVGMPGYTLAQNGSPAGAGKPCRGALNVNGIVYAVFGNKVYYGSNSGGTWTALAGTTIASSGTVTMAWSGTQLLITEPGSGASYSDLATVFAVADPDYPVNGTGVSYIGNRFVVVDQTTNKFYWSDLNSATSWQALNFATAETESGTLVTSKVVNGTLVLFGSTRIEFWTPSVGTDVFARVQGTGLNIGVAAGAPGGVSQVSVMGNTIVLCGREPNAVPAAYTIEGYQATKIVGQDEIYSLAPSANVSLFWTATNYVIYIDGSPYVVFSHPSAAWLYDPQNQFWSQLTPAASWNMNCSAGTYQYTLLFGNSANNEGVYRLDPGVFKWDTSVFTKTIISKHVNNEMNLMAIDEFILDMETGTGTVGTPNPTVSLQVSKDNGHTSVNYGTKALGASGVYGKRIVWRRLGRSRDWVFIVISNDDTPFVLTQAAIKVHG